MNNPNQIDDPWNIPNDNCDWPTCLPDSEANKLTASIKAAETNTPDPHPHAGNPHTCPHPCHLKTAQQP